MPRTKGSKNKVKTTIPTTDFAALIAEKASAKETLTAEITALEENVNNLKAELKAKKAELKKLIKKYGVSLISVGNGPASRESEQVIVELIKELDTPVQYVIVNEAGASVYSASKLATEEFPNFDVGQRSAASIARRLQDPLAELVKIASQNQPQTAKAA